MKRSRSWRRHQNRVHQDRERIARDERRPRGEKTDDERWASELLDRLRAGSDD